MLFDPRAKGRLALVDEPAIGLLDAALAAEAIGALHFENIGNMTPSELVALFRFLRREARGRFFVRCWATNEEGARLLRRSDTAIQSMWSPMYNDLGRARPHVREAAPEEGYRAWHGGISISRQVTGAASRHGVRIS